MKLRTSRVVALVGAVLAGAPVVGTSGLVLPPQRATVAIDTHNVVAGATQPFTITVTNPVANLPAPIRSVRITAPAELAVTDVVEPDGWTSTTDGDAVTLTTTGIGILAGSSQPFDVVATAARPARDRSVSWTVHTEAGRGLGSLGVVVRTLEIVDFAVTAPAPIAGTEDALHVTAGQDNVEVAVTVRNAGSAAQDVSVAFDGAAADAPLAAGETATFPFALHVPDAAGHAKAITTASAAESVAVQRFLAYVVDPRLELSTSTYDGIHWQVAPGTEHVLTARLGYGPGNALTIDPASSGLDLANGALFAPFERGITVGAFGNGAHIDGLRMVPITIPAGFPDGRFEAVLHVEGVDSNGAELVYDLPYPGLPLRVDSDVPTAALELAGPAEPFRNGTTVQLGGQLADGPGDPCDWCYLADSWLEAYDAGGALVGAIPVDGAYCENVGAPYGGCVPGWEIEGGVISGSVQVGEWPAGTVSTRWVATVHDQSGLESTAASAPHAVDAVAPEIVGASTMSTDAGPEDVAVSLSEAVVVAADGVPDQLDWTCDGYAVTQAFPWSSTEMRLVLSPSPGLDATFTCEYRPSGAPITDAAGNPLPATTFVVADGRF